MEPLNATPLASAVIQLVDFSAKVIHKDKVAKVYRSTGTALGEVTLLDDAIANLGDLSQQLEKTRRSYDKGHVHPGQEVADARLIALAKDGGGVAKILQATLNQAKRDNDVDEETVLAQGLRSVLNLYYSQKTISALGRKVDSVRKQVDIALLASLRQSTTRRNQARPKKRLVSIDEAAGPHVLLIESVEHHDWDPTETAHVSAFAHTLKDSVVSYDTESRFIKLILARLHFAGLYDRYKTIPCAHPGTLQWIFDAAGEQKKTDGGDSLSRWLSATDHSNVYWVSGKPGVGKSTLMKFICNHRRTTAHLNAWAKGRMLVKGSFFFSSLGNDMHKSRMGLLQTLLYYVLKGDRGTLIQVFHHRWAQFSAFGGGRQPFTWLELRQAFMTVISEPITPKSFFFAIDGLDESDGNLREVLQLIRDMAKHPHVKVCVASRSSPEVLRAFDGQPCLHLEHFNRQDICDYVAASLKSSHTYVKLSKLTPDRATDLVKGISEKAAGVFLWANIVVHLFLNGMSLTTRISSLTSQLEALPSGLEQRFTKLLGSLKTEHLKHASQLLRLVTVKSRPLLLELWFADSENDDLALRDEARPLSENEVLERIETMNRRLVSRCRGLLEIESWSGSSRSALSRSPHVTWTHRIAKDFVRSQRMWNIILDDTGHDAFDPEWHWANGRLGIFKTVAGTTNAKTAHFTSCIEYALRLEHRLRICPVKFLDEVGRAATIYHFIYDDLVPRKHRGAVSSFLEFAVLFNLTSYVRIKGDTLPKDDMIHASPLVGLLNAKQWEGFTQRFDTPAIWNLDLEESKREMQEVMDILLDCRGGGSRWQRAKKRLSGQRRT